ncbi:3D domain-containing protein [Enterococcus montenegrensis]|uniref:3D domain-containing protein n=1 Tax=Enterococcus TaxID=1350 RepID=UPI001E30D870|nr:MULTISPECIES: 3D domain-containing protein [Enterococcus]MCD1023943.1 3D domain-containing protein [Enterococcus sp. SMC-9]WHA10074.1 3D domain-containing protein [Enterococcus montenegrensis]
MQTRLLPILSATIVIAVGSMLPVYAAENETASQPTLQTELVSKAEATNLSSSLLVETTNNKAVDLVKADIKAKEAAKKAAAEKAKKIAAEKAEKEKAEKEKAAQEAKEAAQQETKAQQANESQPSGQTMMMEATAYSSDPADALGGGSVTATGQNLLANPMAVAVDPSVIPLGTHLYVEGYGEAYAVDTGSAIQGNIIDVHFSTAGQCEAWGRRQVKVTILG